MTGWEQEIVKATLGAADRVSAPLRPSGAARTQPGSRFGKATRDDDGVGSTARGDVGRVLLEVVLLILVCRFLVASAVGGAMGGTRVAVDFGDFNYYYQAASRLNHGQSLYAPDSVNGYVYSPLLATALRPLAHLDQKAAFHLWAYVGAASLLLAGLVAHRALGFRARDLVALTVMLVIGFRFWPTTMNFELGQANLPLLVLIAGMMWAAASRRPYAFAALVVVAALLKTWMGGMFLYLILTRNWRALAAGLGMLAAAMVALFLPLGWGEFRDFLAVTRAYAVQPTLVSQSIAGFARLHFQDNPLVEPIVRSEAAYWGFKALAFAVVGAGLWRLFRRLNVGGRREACLLVGFCAATVLLVIPLCHMEYSVFCLPLIWALVCTPGDGGRTRWALPVAGLGIYLACFTIPWQVNASIRPPFNGRWMSLFVNMTFVGTAALALVAWGCLRGRRGRVGLGLETREATA